MKYDPQRLRWAMMSSARFLPKVSAESQGAGLLQVQGAWEALKHAPDPVNIVSRAPVKEVLSEYLQEPDQGTGIYEREGWTAGQSGQRVLSFTRTSGSPVPMKFLLRWTGNDGTFASPTELTLPLNRPVEVKINISPATNGVHSALLNLVALNGPVMHQVMNTVVAAEQLNTQNAFTITHRGQAEWLHFQSYFVNIPAGTPALKVDVQIADGNVKPFLTRPNGKSYYSLAPNQALIGYTRHQEGGSWSRVVSHPDPGVWQITIDNCNLNKRPPGPAKASFTVTSALLGVRIHSNDSLIDLSQYAHPVKEISFTNTHANFVGEIAKTALASTFTATLPLKKDPIAYEIGVAPGATRVGASIGGNESDSVDLDLYLFDCTGLECVLRDFSVGTGSSEEVAVEAPAAGRWKVIIDPFAAPRIAAEYQYKDYFLHPAFGAVSVQDGPRLVDHGATITQRVSIKVDAVPIGERQPEAILFVTNQPGTNTDNPKNPGTSELYYSATGVLGTTKLRVRLALPQATLR